MIGEYLSIFRIQLIMPISFGAYFRFRIRGTLVSLFDPFMNCGAVFAFVLGKYYNYADQAKFHLVLSVVYMILFARIPDSPQHLVKMQREKVR